jgi:hypothetical protein
MDAPKSRVSWPPPTSPTPTQIPSRPLGHFLHSQIAPSLPLLVRCHFPRARRTATVHRVRAPVLPLTLGPRHACCLGEFRLAVRNSRHTSITLSHSGSLCPRSHVLLRVAGALSPSTRALVVPLSPFKGPRVFSRGNQSPPPIISLLCPRLCVIACRSKAPPPPSHPIVDGYLLVPLRCCRAHTRVCHVPPNLPEPLPAPQAPSAPALSSPVGLRRGHKRRH